MLDTVHEVSTPELIELRLYCAGPVPRALAWLIDQLIRLAALAIISIPLVLLKSTGHGILLIIFFLMEWLYPVLYEVLSHGATPGKRTLGLMVVNQDGSPISWGPSFTRNLLRTADFLPLMYGIGLISMLTTRDARRLGDIVAGTLVIYQRAQLRAPTVPEAPLWRPRGPVSRDAQRAVLAFAERAPRLSVERACELASYAPQLTNGAEDEKAVMRLYGLARVLTGRKT